MRYRLRLRSSSNPPQPLIGQQVPLSCQREQFLALDGRSGGGHPPALPGLLPVFSDQLHRTYSRFFPF
jgi:hypothetical protein